MFNGDKFAEYNLALLTRIIRKRFFYLKKVKEVQVSRLKTSFSKSKKFNFYYKNKDYSLMYIFKDKY